MIRKVHILMAALCFAACTPSANPPVADVQAQSGHDYHVYFLGGQSNMEGYGDNAELPIDMQGPVDGAMIFTGRNVEDGKDGGGIGRWAQLEPGFGGGFDTDGTVQSLSKRFGPELSFGAHMRKMHPERRIAIIKYSRGGTSLALDIVEWGAWDPDYSEKNGRNQYDNALTSIAVAMSTPDIDGDGRVDRLIPAGIVWMQGESDAAGNRPALDAYQNNLTRMMDLLRAAFRVDDLPVVIGRIQDSGDTEETRVMRYSPEMQAIQDAYTAADSCAALVGITETFSFLPDGWHYLSADYVALGEAFAEAALSLEARCGS